VGRPRLREVLAGLGPGLAHADLGVEHDLDGPRLGALGLVSGVGAHRAPGLTGRIAAPGWLGLRSA
jgi:hypothetical protein